MRQSAGQCSTYLRAVVHLARKLRVEEPHQLVDLDAGVPALPPVELGLGVRDARIARTDMVIEVIVVRLDMVVPVAVVERAFLPSAT